MEKKGIILCSPNYNGWGGAEKAIYNLSEFINKKYNLKIYFKDENNLSCIETIQNNIKANTFSSNYENINFEYLKIKTNELVDFSINNNLLLVFNNSFLWNECLCNEIIKKDLEIIIFTHCHCGWLNNKILKLNKNIKCVIGVNEITEKTLNNNNIHVNYINLKHLIKINDCYISQKQLVNKNYINNKPVNIFFSGRCSLEKGIHFIPTIIKKLVEKNVNFIFHVFGGKVDDFDDLMNQFKDKCKFYGYVKNPQLIYKDFDLMIIPSIFSEGLPFTIVEALSHGIMAISTKTYSLIELLNFEENTLVELKSYNKLHENKFYFDDYNLMHQESLTDLEEYTNNFVKNIINAIETNQIYNNKSKRISFIKNNFNEQIYSRNVEKILNT